MSNTFTRIGVMAAACIVSMSASALGKPLSIVLPDDQEPLAQGPGLETAIANCGACHSAEYMKSQPHGPGFGKAFWQAEVTKMISVYKAPISEEDAKVIVDYLAAAYK